MSVTPSPATNDARRISRLNALVHALAIVGVLAFASRFMLLPGELLEATRRDVVLAACAFLALPYVVATSVAAHRWRGRPWSAPTIHAAALAPILLVGLWARTPRAPVFTSPPRPVAAEAAPPPLELAGWRLCLAADPPEARFSLVSHAAGGAALEGFEGHDRGARTFSADPSRWPAAALGASPTEVRLPLREASSRPATSYRLALALRPQPSSGPLRRVVFDSTRTTATLETGLAGAAPVSETWVLPLPAPGLDCPAP